MERIVVVDGNEVTMRATAATLIRYRSTFSRDLIRDLQAMSVSSENEGGEATELADGTAETISRLAYIMATSSTARVSFEDWLDGFSPFAILNAAPEILRLWTDSQQTLVEGKKK